MSSEFLDLLNEVYPTHLPLPPEWTAEQQRDWLERESERLSRLTGALTDRLGEQAVADWTAQHGRHPDYLTTVGLLSTARMSAREQILANEIYEQIPMPEDEPEVIATALATDRAGVPWERRWTDPDRRTDPDEQLEALIELIWPDPGFSMVFRIKAGYLLAARREDGLAIPAGIEEPLARELAALVYADLRSDGLPER